MDLERQFGNYDHERVPMLACSVCLPAVCVTGLFGFDTMLDHTACAPALLLFCFALVTTLVLMAPNTLC